MTNFSKAIALAGDIFVLYLSLAVMLLIRYEPAEFGYRLSLHLVSFSFVFVVWIAIFYLNGLYRFSLRGEGDLFWSIFAAALMSSAASIIIFYIWSDFFKLTPKTNLLIFCALFLVFESILRSQLQKFLAPKNLNVVVLGVSPLIQDTMAHLQEHRTEYNIVTWIKELGGNNIDQLSDIIRNTKLHLAVIQPHLRDDIATMRLVYRLLPLKIVLISFWDFYERIFKKVPLDELRESWFIENIAYRDPYYDVPKRLLDLGLAVPASIVLLPVGLAIGLLIKATTKGPVIYRQRRIGKNGNEFVLYKFRTMKHNSKGPFWTEPQDDRITSLGRYLRFTHLDELPQLINVIRGSLSLIGPRPERLELVEKFRDLPYYNIRHVGKPGLTGWAQINYRPSASLEEAHEKLRYDIYYIKNRSLFLDLHILFRTIKYLITKRQ